MAKTSAARKQECREELLKWLQPGDTVHTILQHRSRSGMYRAIQPVILRPREDGRNCDVVYLGWPVADLLEWGYDQKNEGVRVGGCGMDMGFHLVYSLSQVLFGDGYKLTHRWI